MSISNTGSVDLESVLNVRRRTLASVGETKLPHHSPQYTDTVYLKREDSAKSILEMNSKVFISGELTFLCSIFERYTSNIIIFEEPTTSPGSSNKPSFSATVEEDEHDDDEPPIISTLRQTSISSSKGSSSPPNAPSSPGRRKYLSSVGRSHTIGSTSSDYSGTNLEGKHYGSIQLPNMSVIEILEILLRTGLELSDVSSNYDQDNTLHQNFILSKTRSSSQKNSVFQSRQSSFTGT